MLFLELQTYSSSKYTSSPLQWYSRIKTRNCFVCCNGWLSYSFLFVVLPSVTSSLDTLGEASGLLIQRCDFRSPSDAHCCRRTCFGRAKSRKCYFLSGYSILLTHHDCVLTFFCFIPFILFFKYNTQVRFNTKTRSVEIKTSRHTLEQGSLQKGADFVSAFMMGFEVQDAVALLRLDDLYVESFQVTDVKMLRGDHLSRAIGRIAGQDGKTRFAIENATRTRIVVADQRIHLLGSYANLRVARNAICDLILGAPPGKVYNNMRNVAKRMAERY